MLPLKIKLIPGVDVLKVQVQCCRECANCVTHGKSDKGAVLVVCKQGQWAGPNGSTREITTVIRNSIGLFRDAMACQYFDPAGDMEAAGDWWRQSYGQYLNMRQWARKESKNEST